MLRWNIMYYDGWFAFARVLVHFVPPSVTLILMVIPFTSRILYIRLPTTPHGSQNPSISSSSPTISSSGNLQSSHDRWVCQSLNGRRMRSGGKLTVFGDFDFDD